MPTRWQQNSSKEKFLKIIILGGFLGSGKTSFLKKFAKYILDKEKSSGSKTKVVIIENEIGNVAIDNQILENENLNVKTLFSGCVCCTLQGELVSTIKALMKQENPDWIIIESTGVAYPGSIKEKIQDQLKLNSYIVTLTDAGRWNKLLRAMESLISGQLKDSNQVLLNKIDMVNDDELKNIKDSIMTFNKDVDIEEICAVSNINEEIFEKILTEVKE